MTFTGPSWAIQPVLHTNPAELYLRPYNKTIQGVASSVCQELLGVSEGEATSHRCMFEVRTAFDCVVRSKTRKMGTMMDNMGACQHHIDNMNRGIASTYGLDESNVRDRLDSKLKEIIHMPRSFC